MPSSIALARSMKPGIEPSGSDMSCDEIAPIFRFANGIASRTAQNSRRCASDRAISPSVTRFSASDASKRSSNRLAGSRPGGKPRSTSAIQSGGSAKGRRICGMVSVIKSRPMPEINSKADIPSPMRSWRVQEDQAPPQARARPEAQLQSKRDAETAAALRL